MGKALTQTELEAKMYRILSTLTGQEWDLYFIVVSDRSEEEPDTNRVLIRASYFDGVERFTHKLLEGHAEYAVIKYIEADDENLTQKLLDMSKTLVSECKDVRK